MHDCQRFREDWIAGTEENAADCEDCRMFCEDANIIMVAAVVGAPPLPELSEEQLSRFDTRLRKSLARENAARTFHAYWKWSGVAAAAAIAVVVGWGTLHTPAPQAAPNFAVVDDHIQGLDPMVVAYLERSELFLRDFTKINSSQSEDLKDSRVRAKRSLAEIGEQKQLANNFVPVRITLDKYENVLREIKNQESSEELADIQKRILSSGLIANMKAYQPQLMLVSQHLGN